MKTYFLRMVALLSFTIITMNIYTADDTLSAGSSTGAVISAEDEEFLRDILASKKAVRIPAEPVTLEVTTRKEQVTPRGNIGPIGSASVEEWNELLTERFGHPGTLANIDDDTEGEVIRGEFDRRRAARAAENAEQVRLERELEAQEIEQDRQRRERRLRERMRARREQATEERLALEQRLSPEDIEQIALERADEAEEEIGRSHMTPAPVLNRPRSLSFPPRNKTTMPRIYSGT